MDNTCILKLYIAMTICQHFSDHYNVILAMPSSYTGLELASEEDNYIELTLYKAMESALLNDSGQLFRLKGAFSPAMKYQFWKADGLQAIQFDACLSLSDTSCYNQTKPSVFTNNSTIQRCWQYQWTNSFLLNLIATHQLYQFEPVLTSLIYGETVGHREVHFNLNLNFTDPLLCLVKEDQLEKYLMSFISWVSPYKQL